MVKELLMSPTFVIFFFGIIISAIGTVFTIFSGMIAYLYQKDMKGIKDTLNGILQVQKEAQAKHEELAKLRVRVDHVSVTTNDNSRDIHELTNKISAIRERGVA